MPISLNNLTRLCRIEWAAVNIILCVSIYLLYQGVTLPIMSFNQFKYFGNTFSILSGINVLKQNNEMILYLLVLGFSVILPIIKLCLLFIVWNSPYSSRKMSILSLMIAIGRWSMLDVMVIAILVSWVKIDLIANVSTHNGLGYFMAAVLMILLIKSYISWRLKSKALRNKNA